MNHRAATVWLVTRMTARLTVCLFVSSIALTTIAAEPIEFAGDIVPLLTKHGCNAGACHGSAAGRGGLKLSLYGANPRADYHAIVEDLEGRRVNQLLPDESLIVLKPTETIAHAGGHRFDDDSQSRAVLVDWIKQGA
ncbi:MAG: cell surface protein, partial [Planctomycetota bacterium]